MLLPLKVDRTRVERLAEVPFGRASFEVGALISPRTSCSCCCNNIVEARICSQPSSGCPVIFEVTHEVTGRGLPKAFERPATCPLSPSTPAEKAELMSILISAMRLRPWSPTRLPTPTPLSSEPLKASISISRNYRKRVQL